mmetsp:Transcript_5746/g.21862  ORF Transcript_5746/g.21862 Transcript_5746/m.21862 type:complete len:340 (+) Transcript_5746:226-1245(+)
MQVTRRGAPGKPGRGLTGGAGATRRDGAGFGTTSRSTLAHWKPATPEEAKRFEDLQETIPLLQEVLQQLQDAKARLAAKVTEARRSGTRQDRGEVLESRLALIENAKVREVEWAIPNLSELLEKCPKGQSIVSPLFGAAGVPNMQLVFHPNGNKEAREGYCSLALKLPDGTRLSRVLYVNHEALGPDITRQPLEGYTNACQVHMPSPAVRGTAADAILVGVRDLHLQGWGADPTLQRVLLIGDAPAAEINFELLREMRDRERLLERAQGGAAQARGRGAKAAPRGGGGGRAPARRGRGRGAGRAGPVRACDRRGRHDASRGEDGQRARAAGVEAKAGDF